MSGLPMPKSFFLFLILIFSLVPNLGAAEVFNPKTFHLPNGMQVVLIENHRAPVVSHMVWYNVGAADEEPGKSGLAHFFEHLMFKGTDTVAPGAFSKIVKRLGGNDNAFTSQDYTGYYQNIPKKHLETVMKMEADRMTNLDASKENILTERDVIIEERKQRTDNNPSAILREEVNNALFANHPYGTPVIGWMSEIKGLTPDSVREFYNKWYAPNNAILVVSGDMTVEELRPLAEKYYGQIEPTSVPDRLLPDPAPIKTDHRITYRDPRVGTPVIQFKYRAPRGSEAMEVLASAFGGTTTSQLYRSLVVEQQKAVQTGIYYTPVSRGPGSVTVYAIPAPGTSVEDMEAVLKDEIDQLLEQGIAEQEIERAQQRLVDAAIYGRDSLMGPAMVIGRALTAGFDLDYVENWPEAIKSVNMEDVITIRDQVFNGENRPVISYLLPLPQPETPPAPTDIDEEVSQ
jgi:zinc protease